MVSEDNCDEHNSFPSQDREILIQLILSTLTRKWNHFKISANDFMENHGVYTAVNKVAQLSARYPLISLAVTVGLFTLALPVAIIAAFAVSTIVLTFAGFFVLEGTLLTIALVLLFGCLGALLLVLVFFGVFAIAGYFGFAHIYHMYRGDKSMIQNVFLRENVKNLFNSVKKIDMDTK